jgi:hypothetical protein
MTDNLRTKFYQVVNAFVANEADLFSVDVNERTISSKLACYLDRCFADWDVDCEYNRLGSMGTRKLIDLSKEKFSEAKEKGVIPEHITTLDELEKSGLGVSVFPDIIVHHRTHKFENLLIVEIKKANNPDVGLGWDEFKIHFFIEKLQYKAGAFVVFNTESKDDNKTNLVKSFDWFE